ncbi:MAG: MEMO1 family protein [Candidatus Rifleibacteriota bacterium]
MIRQPCVAGRFYQGNKSQLLAQIESCYQNVLGIRDQKLEKTGKLKALVSPHAGYVFSGPPATYGFSRLKLENPLPERIILMGPKHTPYGALMAVDSSRAWLTPLGEIPVDEDFADLLVKNCKGLELDSDAHRYEHSIEVQLPFLQHLYQDAPLRIVPIAFGYTSFANLAYIAKEMKAFLAAQDLSKTLFLVSSDFSHDTAREEAYRLDAEVIDLVLKGDAEEFYHLIIDEDRSVCGVMPLTVLLLLLEGRKVITKLLKYSTSMDVMDHDRGVGYASISFEEPE